jgi:hypothetical protein
MLFDVIFKILQVYTLVVFVRALLPLFTKAQNRWTVLLDRVCEPALKMGRAAAAKVLPDRRFSFDVGPVAALLLMLLILFVLKIIF